MGYRIYGQGVADGYSWASEPGRVAATSHEGEVDLEGVRIVELSRSQWEERYPRVDSPYLDPRWLRVLETVYPRLRIHRLSGVDDQGKDAWLLPLVEISPLLTRRRSLVSVPFGNYGGIEVLRPLTPEVLRDTRAALAGFLAGVNASSIELRGESTVPDLSVSSYFKRFILELPPESEVLWPKISSNARNMVRKVLKAGVTVAVHGPDALAIFQEIYEEQAKEHGTPIHALDWFPQLVSQFAERAFFVVATKEGRAVGAAFVLDGLTTAFLHSVVWRRGLGSLPVADLLYWKSICESIVRKKASIDFGRTRPVEGQLFFKRKWGAVESTLSYSYLSAPGFRPPVVSPEKGVFRALTLIWRNLPLPVLRTIGPLIRTKIQA